MRLRALFLLSLLTFGCLSEAQPTPGGIKDMLTATAIVMRLIAQLHLWQNTRTILPQEGISAARAMMPRSPFHHASPVHSSVMAHLQPPVIRTGIGAVLQARPVHTSTTTLAASNRNQGVSDQNIQPNEGSAGLASGQDHQGNMGQLAARLRILKKIHRTRFNNRSVFWTAFYDGGGARNLPTPSYRELAVLATELGRNERGTITPVDVVHCFRNGLWGSVLWGSGEMSTTVTTMRYPGLWMMFFRQLWNHGRSLSAFLQNLFRGPQDNSIQSGDVPDLSANSIAPGEGSRGDGGSMEIVPTVFLLDLRPGITDELLVNLTSDAAQVIHNHPHSAAPATAIALAARSSIDYLESSRRGQRPSRLEFAQATIARIRRHVQDDHFLYYLGIVEQNLDGSNSHESVMSQLYRAPSEPAAANDEGVLTDFEAPNNVAAALYFFFTETQSQRVLPVLVKHYIADINATVVGAILMTLSVLRDGGIRRDEFSADAIRRLLESFPEEVNIRRIPDIFLIDPPADKDDDSPEPVSEQNDQEFELQAVLQNMNERLGTSYPSIGAAIDAMHDRKDVRNFLIPFSETVEAIVCCDGYTRPINEEQGTNDHPSEAPDTLIPSYEELISLGEALGASRIDQELQAASSQQQAELLVDDTQAATTVHRADDTVQDSHNHLHSVTAATGTATALAALSSIEYREFLEREQRPSRLEFAEATIARIRRHVQNDRFLYYLGIVEQNLDGNNTHESVMSQLNSDTSGRAAANDERIFIDTAAALYFFFTEIRSQQALLNLVEQYTVRSDRFGTTLMMLSVLREGGIRRDEFSVDEIRSLLEGSGIRNNPDIFLIDPPADKDTPAEPGKKED